MGSPILWTLHYVTLDSSDHSRFPLCDICVSQAAAVQCFEQGLCLCQTCISKVNAISRFLLYNVSNNNSGYNFPPKLDSEYTFSSSSSSFIDLDWDFPFLPLSSKTVTSSPFPIFQNVDNHKKNCNDQQVQMIQPDYMEIPKDCSYLGFESYETKDIENVWHPFSGFESYETKDIANVWLNIRDNDKTILDQKEYFSGEELILTDPLDEIMKHNPETTTEIISASSSRMSPVIHTDYNIEALANASCEDYQKNQLANASCEDYQKNQMIGLKAKEETNNNAGIFPNAHIQLECRPSQLILTDVDEMLDQTLASGVYNPQARLEALKRYLAKKKKRKFGKQIRYESRKSTADTKKRLKGRFTKAGAEYDYDPRANNTNKEANKIMTY